MFREILDNEIEDDEEEELVHYKGHDHVLVAKNSSRKWVTFRLYPK